MAVAEVAEGIRRLTQGVVNFYLCESGGRLVLVDAGAPHDWELLTRSLAALGRKLGDLEAVLLTHAHGDHVGFAERARATAGAKVWIHEADGPVAQGEKPAKNDRGIASYLFRPALYKTVFSLLRRGAARMIPIRELSTFTDGEKLDLPGTPRVVFAPGHTPGCSALLFEDQRVLLTGDALVTWNPLTGRTGPQIMPAGFNQDTPLALRSLAAVERTGADLILPGHGDPWKDGAKAAVARARAAGSS